MSSSFGDAFVGGFLSQLVKDKLIEYLLNEAAAKQSSLNSLPLSICASSNPNPQPGRRHFSPSRPLPISPSTILCLSILIRFVDSSSSPVRSSTDKRKSSIYNLYFLNKGCFKFHHFEGSTNYLHYHFEDFLIIILKIF
ncbi:hypothetical protein P8452_23227 [Trifolium repens]|nr:hypothetical protein P8452_23227 [Trifolium repens]